MAFYPACQMALRFRIVRLLPLKMNKHFSFCKLTYSTFMNSRFTIEYT